MVDGSHAPSPSEALANLASNLHELGNPDWLVDHAVQAWEADELEALGTESTDEWQLSPAELFRRPSLARIRWPAPLPKDFTEWRSQATALQMLDRWHAPLSGTAKLGSSQSTPFHEALADRLAIEQNFAEVPNGLLIPSSTATAPTELSPRHADFVNELLDEMPLAYSTHLLSQLLENTSFIPKIITHTTSAGPRSHRISYRSITSPLMTGIIDMNTTAVAVAPVIETPKQAGFCITSERFYEIVPKIDEQHLRSIVRDAVQLNATIALLPEMAINGYDLSIISNELQKLFIETGIEAGGAPTLRFLLVGATDASSQSGKAANYVVVMDAMGNILFSQRKLFRWDLNRDQIERYGIHRTHWYSENEIFENINEYDTFTVIDLHGLGRLLILICADADHDSPGDWAYVSIRADIIYMPVMDMTNSEVKSKADLTAGRWMIKRAARAAYISRSLAISTNSVYLTHLVNSQNFVSGVFPAFTHVEIGLFVDGRPHSPRLHQEIVEVEATDVVCRVDISDAWREVPT